MKKQYACLHACLHFYLYTSHLSQTTQWTLSLHHLLIPVRSRCSSYFNAL